MIARGLHRGIVPSLLLAGTLLPAGVAAQRPELDSAVARCFAADTASAWRRVAAAWSKARDGPIRYPQLRDSLLALGRRDQALRTLPGIADSLQLSPSFGRRLMASDSADAAALLGLVARYGWPGRSLVGREAASAAFLIAQHNASIQHPALRYMRALASGEVSPSDLAMLEDRVRGADGEPQLYGTQLDLQSDHRTMVFKPIEDLAHVDERRARMGLYPLSTYMCLMHAMYEREIVDPRGGGGR